MSTTPTQEAPPSEDRRHGVPLVTREQTVPHTTQQARIRRPPRRMPLRLPPSLRLPPLPRSSIRRGDLLAVAFFIGIGLWAFSGMFNGPYQTVTKQNTADMIWFQWLMEHAAYSVRHLSNPFFSVRQNFPFGVNLMANTSVLGVSLPLTPITMLLGGEITYWVILVGGPVATATTSYYVLSRHVVTSRVGAALGGAFLGFAPGVLTHSVLGQPNFTLNFLVPFLILHATRIGRPGRVVRDGVCLALLVTWQFFINQEILLITAAVAGIVVLTRARALWPRRRAVLGTVAVTAAIALTLLVYPMWFEFRGPQSYRGLPGKLHWVGEDILAFVSFARDTVAGGEDIQKTIGRNEQDSYFGWPLVLVVIGAAVLLWRRSRTARVASLIGLGFAIAGLGPELSVNGEPRDIPAPWALVTDNHLPLANLLVPARLTLVTTAVVGLLVALAWDHLPRISGERRRRVCTAAIVLALVPTAPWALPTKTAPPIPEFITGGHWRPYVPPGFSMLPLPVPNNSDGMFTLRWSVQTGQEFPIPHGYFLGPDENGKGLFGPPPRETTYWVNHVSRKGELAGHDEAHKTSPSEGMRVRMRQDLVYWRVAIVVLGPQEHEDALRQMWEHVLGKPMHLYGAYVWDVRWMTAPRVNDPVPPVATSR